MRGIRRNPQDLLGDLQHHIHINGVIRLRIAKQIHLVHPYSRRSRLFIGAHFLIAVNITYLSLRRIVLLASLQEDLILHL